MNKNYYKKLSQKYLDAALSPREERRLMAFLSKTEDPEFDEVKAVASFFAQGKSMYAVKQVRPVRRWMVPAGIAAALLVGVSLTLTFQRAQREEGAIQSMERTLASIFSSGTDIETELSELLTP